MRRRLLISGLLSMMAPFSFAPGAALAQGAPPPSPAPAPAQTEPPPAAPVEPSIPEPQGEPAPEPAPSEPAPPAGEPGTLAPPSLGPIELQTPSGPTLPSPDDAATKLQQAAPPPPKEKKRWTLPETMFHLHGYFRMRAALLKDGALGHSPSFDRLSPTLYPASDLPLRTNFDPFPFFVPADSTIADPYETFPDDQPVIGGCGDNAGPNGSCDKKTQVSGDMRLRLKPEIHLSDDIRLKAWIDVLDNVGLGTMGDSPNDLEFRNVINVRRVWGEARNRDIGELRFGRMARDWGLGILDNGGDRYGIDSDFSSDADRVMAISNLAGFYLMAAYDWADEGIVLPGAATPNGVPIDRAQKDDLNVVTAAVARRLEPEVQQSALLRGEYVFNFGAYFVWRNQLLTRNPASVPGLPDAETSAGLSPVLFTRLKQTQYIPDLWLQFLWEGLRLELEAVFVAGTLEGGCPKLIVNEDDPKGPARNAEEVIQATAAAGQDSRGSQGECKFRQFGLALESEYRLYDDRLGIHFMTGVATGDSKAYGLAFTNDPSLQQVDNANQTASGTISTYQFHPDYRIDLILWRTLMRRVAGAYYFKPGISYDFIRDPYGQQAGGRVDLIYSRASTPQQTWGKSGNLGLELDVTLYYRSEDGPDVMDGFYGLVQWGILFPFQGLDYADDIVGAPSSKNAMIFRGVAGIAF